ncbi:MAG TPA: T9SS type A sorting domain-containing protein, partial [Chryseolinea sp.]|nr:T9SS type A sorting domain-containing protein [Chryseolinea sp.]
FVLKLDTSGNFEWLSPFSTLSYGSGIATDGAHVYVTGYFMGTAALAPSAVSRTSKGMVDTFMLKLTAAGEHVWVRQIGGPGDDYGRSISLDNSGNVYFAGEFQQTCDFNINGTTTTLTSAGMYDIFLQKFSSAGNLLWVKKIGGAGIDVARNISISSTGGLFVAGQINGTASFDIGSIPESFSSAEGGLFVLNVTPSEEIGWILQYQANDFWMTAEGDHVYATGEFFATIDFDPGEATKSMTATSGGSAFVLKLESKILEEEVDEEEEEEEEEEENITGIEDATQTRFSIYPNPVKSVAFIDLEKNSSAEFTLRVKDVHNRIVKEQIIQNDSKNQIDMTALSDGLYIIEVSQSGNRISTAKVMKN